MVRQNELEILFQFDDIFLDVFVALLLRPYAKAIDV